MAKPILKRMDGHFVERDYRNPYYRGLREWGHIDGYLTDTCLTAQDNYKTVLDYFRIEY